MINDCIAAVATAEGTAGISVIRLSGAGCFEVTDRVFACAKGPAKDWEPRKLHLGRILGEDFSDRAMAVTFHGPHSFTGEDAAELHCHGGRELTRAVLGLCLSRGARLAEPGEFTRRAFLNGKLDLSACEGLAELLHARSRAEINAGYTLLQGALKEKIAACQEELLDLLAGLEVLLDYPEEDLPPEERDRTREILTGIGEELDRLSAGQGKGEKVRSGVKTVLAGRVNAGKSSLLNALLGTEKAIVTEIAGTTRDVVEGELELGGVRFLLFDTAGIRESPDRLEQLGVARSRKALESADLVLCVREGGRPDPETEALAAGRPTLWVNTKADLGRSEAPGLWVSARTGEGLEELRAAMLRTVGLEDLSGEGELLLQERHYDVIRRARQALAEAMAGIGDKLPELLAQDVREVWEILGEITGKTASQEVVDRIFSAFCLGK